MQSTTVQHAPVIAPALAEVTLDLPGLDYPLITAVLDVDDTEAQTPYLGVLGCGGVGVDFTDPAEVAVHLAAVEAYAAGVRQLADRLHAMQAGGAR